MIDNLEVQSIAEQAGWDDESLLYYALAFIEDTASMEKFIEFLSLAQQEENSYTAEDLLMHCLMTRSAP